MDITLQDQLACARHELRQRIQRYPLLVERRMQTQAWSDWQLAAMAAIVQTLERLVAAEQFAQPVEDEAHA